MTRKHDAPNGGKPKTDRLNADDVVRILNDKRFRKGEETPGPGFHPESPETYGEACAYDLAARLVKWCRKNGRISDARVIWAEFCKVLFDDDIYLVRLMGFIGKRYHDFVNTHATIGWLDLDTSLDVWRNSTFITPAARALCACLAYRGLPFVEFDDNGAPEILSFPDFSPCGVFESNQDALSAALSFCCAFMEIDVHVFGMSTLKTNLTDDVDSLLSYGELEHVVLPKIALRPYGDEGRPGGFIAGINMSLALRRRSFGDIVPIDISSILPLLDEGNRCGWDPERLSDGLLDKLTDEQSELMDALFGDPLSGSPSYFLSGDRAPSEEEPAEEPADPAAVWQNLMGTMEFALLPEELKDNLRLMMPLVEQVETLASLDFAKFGAYANRLPEEEKRKVEEEYETENLSKMDVPWCISHFYSDSDIPPFPPLEDLPEDLRIGLKLVKVFFNRLDQIMKAAYEHMGALNSRMLETERRKYADFDLRGWIEAEFREAVSEDWTGDEYRTGRIRCLSGLRLAAERIKDDRRLYATVTDLCSAWRLIEQPLFQPCDQCPLFGASDYIDVEAGCPGQDCHDPYYTPLSLAVDFARKCREDNVFVCDASSAWPLMTGIFTDDVDNLLAVIFAHGVQALDEKDGFSEERIEGWASPIDEIADILLDEYGVIHDELVDRVAEEGPVPLWSMAFTRDGVAVRSHARPKH